MTFKRTEHADGSWTEDYTGSDLDDLLKPAGRCSACGRMTWEPGMVGRTCFMPQPDGSTCPGVFHAA